ncbi:GNAT superfamily N-acetyltransferase [Arthrobacter pigmenti]|uniref:GNAT superfamily N-acetyltransferase n=1 Tax=Arthrobacter pigmenti TaxID=271432 RepID=A0A846RLL7_9MICC|nr:GNAT family N-acetyltransferase [Arthrobacter pigmenti]NJC21007.1 GNAT superfamily N-acetyltransferase [Arthrobacter pigmenti]
MSARSSFPIVELTIPSTMQAPGAPAFEAMVEVRNRVETGILGSGVLSYSAAELLPGFQNPYKPRRLFVAHDGGNVVARAILSWVTAAGSSTSSVTVEVDGAYRRRGIGSTMLDQLEDIVRGAGRPIIQSSVLHTAHTSGPSVAASSGFGSVPATDPGVRFLISRGYRLEQIKRVSFLEVGQDSRELTEHRKNAERIAGPDYELKLWSGATPPEYLTDLARLKTAMSLDDPPAGLKRTVDAWDEARIIKRDQDQTSSGRELLTAAVLHLPSGSLVGFTEISLPADVGGAAAQEDTLVISEHRGFSLGMLLKTTNLQRLGPETKIVYTFNAEENRPMLRVNEALGFRAVGYEGGWEKSIVS